MTETRRRTRSGRCAGAYSLVLLTRVQAHRGPRPLRLPPAVARRAQATRWRRRARETCAFDLIEAEFVRDARSGRDGRRRRERACAAIAPSPQARRAAASSSRSTSRAPTRSIDRRSVYRAREQLGPRLAEEHPVEADVVIPVPDSGIAAAIGYARESGIPFGHGPHALALRGADVHRAVAVDPPLRREAQALAGARGARRASASWSSTTRSCAAPPRARSSG